MLHFPQFEERYEKDFRCYFARRLRLFDRLWFGLEAVTAPVFLYTALHTVVDPEAWNVTRPNMMTLFLALTFVDVLSWLVIAAYFWAASPEAHMKYRRCFLAWQQVLSCILLAFGPLYLSYPSVHQPLRLRRAVFNVMVVKGAVQLLTRQLMVADAIPLGLATLTVNSAVAAAPGGCCFHLTDPAHSNLGLVRVLKSIALMLWPAEQRQWSIGQCSALLLTANGLGIVAALAWLSWTEWRMRCAFLQSQQLRPQLLQQLHLLPGWIGTVVLAIVCVQQSLDLWLPLPHLPKPC